MYGGATSRSTLRRPRRTGEQIQCAARIKLPRLTLPTPSPPPSSASSTNATSRPWQALALLAAAVFPGRGRDPLFLLAGELGPEGYEVSLDSGEEAGRLALFDEPLVEALNTAVGLVRSPAALAFLLEAAGLVALERCGAILEQRISGADPAADTAR